MFGSGAPSHPSSLLDGPSHPYPSPLRHALAACLLALVWIPAAGCGTGGGEGSRPPAPPRAGQLAEAPPIVLITLDTLRADHLGLYGHVRETSPNLDRLGREALVFERAYATSGTTLPSHLSILTGLLPHQHGYTANHGNIPGDISGPWQPTPGRRSVAELLAGEGYDTAAFVSGPTVWKETGIGVGFGHFDQPGPGSGGTRRAGPTTDRALAWLEERLAAPRKGDSEAPFFLWVHYWDPHEPNEPLPEYRQLYRAGAGIEGLMAARRVDAAELDATASKMDRALFFAPHLVRPLVQGRGIDLPTLDHAALLDLHDRYDADVRYLDHHLGRLFARLEELGLWERILLAVAGDHGQGLGEHDWLAHGRIHPEILHVPLILRLPPDLVEGKSLEGLRLHQVVSLVDVMPTLLARFDGPAGALLAEQAEGEDLLSGSYRRNSAFAQRTTRQRPDWHGGLQFALTTAKWRYVHRTEHPDELYDLEADPRAFENVIGDHPRTARELRRRLERTLLRQPEAELEVGTEHSKELEEQLRSLGYL